MVFTSVSEPLAIVKSSNANCRLGVYRRAVDIFLPQDLHKQIVWLLKA